MTRIVLISPLMLAACAASESAVRPYAPVYLGAEAALLGDGDEGAGEAGLVQVSAAMRGARTTGDVEDYAACAMAQLAVDEGYGFARHLRTRLQERGGVSSADTVYTLSSDKPRGLVMIDTKDAVETCAEHDIPTV
ncbi:hypothetical protein [Pontibaca methylaminivorans]|uniref:Lipoprotein n=1 Tax=Pontibaca methylaminivorans TaxID=515897 RepID=A0A1R3WEG5_9RHOB|nr:hypothetical protein [Pontibaca methylaminivorans]SIT76470.1 hypothetical protein SAMN05421849_0521 [Pontibaca methylaminivorans]